MKELSVEDQIYLCKYHDVDKKICYTTGLKMNEIEEVIKKLKDEGLYEKYRNMSDEEYEEIIKDKTKKSKYKNTNVQASKGKKLIEEPTEIDAIENTYVKVSVRTIMDWSYQKGYLDRMLEEEK